MPAHPPVWIVTNRQFADHQGHNLLARHLSGRGVTLAGWTGSLQQRLFSKLLRQFPNYRGKSPSLAYHINLANKLSSYPRARVGLLHLIWGDELIEHLQHPEHVVVTLHQPFELWSEKTWRQIARCAGVICMAERECGEIRRRLPDTSCVFIPHGIDVDFWHPTTQPPRRQVCAVGRYMRNFPMLFRVARALLARHPDVTMRWLVNPDFQLSPELMRALPSERFELVRNLSAAELHRFYAESWLFFTPYNNVTASNAIVESMASGTPVFTTRVGGMASYAGADAITMTPNDDDDAMLAALTRCLDSADERAKQAIRGRSYAESDFAWPRVVLAHEKYYESLLGSAAPEGSRPRKQR